MSNYCLTYALAFKIWLDNYNTHNETTTETDKMTLQQHTEAIKNMTDEALWEYLIMVEENAPQKQLDEYLTAWLPK